MGYFGNGFVFTSPPSWDALAGVIPPAVSLRAYSHHSAPVWLLDAWVQTKRQHWPFTDDFPEETDVSCALPDSTHAVLQRFEALCEVLPGSEFVYGHGWLRATAALAVASGVNTFFFGADDEVTDFACLATPHGFARFRVRFGTFSVEFRESGLFIVPFAFDEDPDANVSPAALATLARVSDATVEAPRVIPGGLPLYESAVTLWPFGDPGALLGVGTWDPFLNIESDLTTVFERVAAQPQPESSPPATQAAPRPWWRFWG